MKLPYTVGIEMTGIPTKELHTGYNGGAQFGLASALATMLRREFHKNKLIRDVVEDDQCVEVKSKIIRESSDLKRFYTTVRTMFDKFDIHPKCSDTVCGGGHIHLGVRNQRLIQKIWADLLKRPYLPWVFSEADEMGACDYPLAGRDTLRQKIANPTRNPLGWREFEEELFLTLTDPNCPIPKLNFIGDKGDYLRKTGFGTIEFRFFEAPLNWREQKLQLDWVFAYMKWIVNQPFKPITREIVWSSIELNRLTRFWAETSFNKFIVELGLKQSDYEPFVKRNLYPRWELDRIRR